MARRAAPLPAIPQNPTASTPGRRRLGDVDVVADILGVSIRSVWRRVADGTLPRPISLGRSKRWDLDAIESWIVAHSGTEGKR